MPRKPGDVLMLAPGATFTGNFTLPVKVGHRASSRSVPRRRTRDLPGRRRPHDAGLRRAAAEDSVDQHRAGAARRGRARTTGGCSSWSSRRRCSDTARSSGIGEGARAADARCRRCRTKSNSIASTSTASPLYGQKRGIALNGRKRDDPQLATSPTSRRSASMRRPSAGWNGPGPFTIENNYLEGAGENFLLGGSDPAIPDLVSENVVVPLQLRDEADVVAGSDHPGAASSLRVRRWRAAARCRPASTRTVCSRGGRWAAARRDVSAAQQPVAATRQPPRRGLDFLDGRRRTPPSTGSTAANQFWTVTRHVVHRHRRRRDGRRDADRRRRRRGRSRTSSS